MKLENIKSIIIVVLAIVLCVIIGFNINQTSTSIELKNQVDELIPSYEYFKDYAYNKTSFDDRMSWYGNDDMRYYYTFDRIWMTEEEYIKIIWLNMSKWYNDSEIWIDGFGFNKSGINISYVTFERYDMKPYSSYWKENGTWYIVDDVINYITKPIELEDGGSIYGGTFIVSENFSESGR